MNRILEVLKENKLQQQEFVEFLGMRKNKFDHAMRKNDSIYLKGLESKLKEFIDFKIDKLKKIKI